MSIILCRHKFAICAKKPSIFNIFFRDYPPAGFYVNQFSLFCTDFAQFSTFLARIFYNNSTRFSPQIHNFSTTYTQPTAQHPDLPPHFPTAQHIRKSFIAIAIGICLTNPTGGQLISPYEPVLRFPLITRAPPHDPPHPHRQPRFSRTIHPIPTGFPTRTLQM